MCVHLVTNASVLDGPGTFQRNVHAIHNLGSALLFVEWTFIFLPILFHGILGLLIVCAGKSNTRSYPLSGNIRYTLQRSTGIIAFVFILVHVFHLHGWFHIDLWLEYVVKPLGGARFYPYNAASTCAAALQSSYLWIAFYAIGVLACVYHLANGIWTMGVTWGVWTRPASQQRASAVCAIFGVGLAAIGLAALWGMETLDIDHAAEIENRQYEQQSRIGVIIKNEEKRAPQWRHKTNGNENASASDAIQTETSLNGV
jgi:succinate dehydrogenase / fumarate reductase cytochrome b subunit